MRHHVWPLLAVASALSLIAGTRPHYGGTLRIQLAGPLRTIDPVVALADPQESWRRDRVSSSIFEPLVNFDPHGRPAACLAVSWRSSEGERRWDFELRRNANFHDGTPLVPASVVEVLSEPLDRRYGDATVTANGNTVVIQSSQPMRDLLFELSRPRNSIVRRNGEDLFGTGPFRIVEWQRGIKAVLSANEGHWAGRPYLDSLVYLADASSTHIPDLAAADVFELPVSTPPRLVSDRLKLVATLPNDLIAIVLDKNEPVLSEAISLAIDRASIANVLTQKRAVPAGALLPEWLSGYAFLFPPTTSVTRARELAAPERSRPVTLGYPADDPLLLAIAERVLVNARDIGLNIHAAPISAGPEMRIMRIRLDSADAADCISGIIRTLALSAPIRTSARLQDAFELERSILASGRIIPIIHVPQLFGVSARVRDWDGVRAENAWLQP